MLRAPLRGMPRPCDYSRGSVFAWNRLEALIEETMLYLSTAEKVRETDLLELGTKHLDMGTPFESAEALRDHLIELVSVRNLKHRREALLALFRQFLQRLTLPRPCHFLDVVLPQLTPVRAHGHLQKFRLLDSSHLAQVAILVQTITSEFLGMMPKLI